MQLYWSVKNGTTGGITLDTTDSDDVYQHAKQTPVCSVTIYGDGWVLAEETFSPRHPVSKKKLLAMLDKAVRKLTKNY